MPKVKIELHKIGLNASNGLDRTAIRLLNRELLRALKARGLTKKYTKVLPYKFDYEWVNKEGKLSSRIEKFLYKDYGVKLENTEKERLGQLSRLATANQGSTYYAGLRPINWKAGDYGDRGSCFWGGSRSNKTSIKKAGGKGFVLHNPENPNEKLSRALVTPMPQFGANCWFLINVYTQRGRTDQDIRSMANLFKQYMEQVHNKKKLRVKTTTRINTNIYVNGGRGCLIGDKNSIKEAKKFAKDHNGRINFLTRRGQ